MPGPTYREKRLLEQALRMDAGHVLDLSKRELAEFFRDVAEVDIYSDAFDYESGSKANRVRAFWQTQSDFLIARVIRELLEIASESDDADPEKIAKAHRIADRLEDAGRTQPLREPSPEVEDEVGKDVASPASRRPIEIFFSYSHADEHLMDDVRRQFIVYERQGHIIKWYDREILPGGDVDQEIDERLYHAEIIILFVSPHFIESRYCYERELEVALERHEAGDARVIPVILRPCAWEAAPFGHLLALPEDGKPVTQWPDRDVAGLDVVRGVMRVVSDLRGG